MPEDTPDIVDVVSRLADAARLIADSIKPLDACQGTDATGGTITSLTEATMGMTAGLCQIADSINNLADAVREHTIQI